MLPSLTTMTGLSKINSCGIDFGTTNSTVAVVIDGRPVALNIDPSNKNPQILKSLIYINPSHEKVVGKEAVERYLGDIKNIPAKVPELIDTGRKIKTFGPSTGSGAGPVIWVPEIVERDVSGRGRLLQSLKSVLTSETFTGSNIFGKFYGVENLLSIILSEIRKRSEKIMECKIQSVVLGRPVRYVGQGKESLALERMTKVANMAGFAEVMFEYEPVGAALNYGVDITQNSKVLVFDFGGGTLDVCVMSFPDKKVVSVSGRPIGGDLINSIIVEKRLAKYFGSEVTISGKMPMPRYFLQVLTNWYAVTLYKNVNDLSALEELKVRADDKGAVAALRDLIVNDLGFEFFRTVDGVKTKLSDEDNAWFRFWCGKLEIGENIYRNEFEEMLVDQLAETDRCLDEALKMAGLTTDGVDRVLITGGSSKIPIFMKLLKDKFGQDKLVCGDRYTSVALGLALRADEIFAK